MNDWASSTVYFRVVYRSCVVSVDQVDTCHETKYLACVPRCLGEILIADAGLAMPGQYCIQQVSRDFLIGTIHVVTVTFRSHRCSL